MSPHLFRFSCRYLMIVPLWIYLGITTCSAQTMWQMVYEDELRQEELNAVEAAERSESDATRQLAVERGWRKNITATIFWVGEEACRANPVHNRSSSWDMRWIKSFGGTDHPYKRIGYRPKYFKPKMNPFYVALPYNDISPKNHQHKPEVSKIIWWYGQGSQNKFVSVCKGRWIAIKYRGKVCYAQWEDCGPFVTDDWEYVFKGERPKPNKNNSAGIDLSPAIRDYLKLSSGEKVSWRFVEDSDIERGPWSKWLTERALLTTNP